MRRFKTLDSADRRIVFYAEDAASWVHFEPIVRELTVSMGRRVCYLTSSPDDPILRANRPNLLPFYVGNGAVLIYLFMTLQARVFVMTMPDLDAFHLKRSKLFPVHYVHVFHAMISHHMVFRRGALDAFDTVFCCGPHHVREMRAVEAVRGLKPRNLVEHGYSRLDSLLRAKSSAPGPLPGNKKRRVLVAPSWGPHALLENYGLPLVKILLEGGYFVTVRPHPMTQRHRPEVVRALIDGFGDSPDFNLETDVASVDSLLFSEIMISDWSGAAWEFAFGMERPVLFVDVPRKVNNPAYLDIPHEPVEVTYRHELGAVVSVDRLAEVPRFIEELCAKIGPFQEGIRLLRARLIYNVGTSGRAGAAALVQLADSDRRGE